MNETYPSLQAQPLENLALVGAMAYENNSARPCP